MTANVNPVHALIFPNCSSFSLYSYTPILRSITPQWWPKGVRKNFPSLKITYFFNFKFYHHIFWLWFFPGLISLLYSSQSKVSFFSRRMPPNTGALAFWRSQNMIISPTQLLKNSKGKLRMQPIFCLYFLCGVHTYYFKSIC